MSNNVPEIRFPDFTEPWEERTFGELYEVNNERNKDLIGFNKTFSIANMTYKDEGNGAAYSSLANYKVLRIGDIAFEGHTNKEFRYGRFVINDVGDGIMSPRFSTLRPIENMPVSFWKYYIHYEPVMRSKLVCSTKAGTMMNELIPSEFLEQDILVPSIKEQMVIGSFFANLDILATLQQRKLDEIKEYKKGLLQKMFPKEEEKVPEIRFPEFKEPWEKRKLGETNTFFTDGNYGEAYPKASDITDSSKGIPFLTGGNLKSGKLDITSASYITQEKHAKLTSGHLIEDDIVIAVRGSLGALGYVKQSNVGWNINSQLAILRTDKSVLNGKFLIQFLLSGLGQKELLMRQTGSALKQLPIGSVKDVPIPITSIEEQNKIGRFLEGVDNLITLHQLKYDKIKEYKKGLLQKMFV